jgi:hypothetical protein
MTRRLIHDESGVALVIAIVTMLVLGSLTSALLFSVAVNHRSAYQSANAERAFGLAEEGIAYAEGRLYASPQSDLTLSSTLPSGDSTHPAFDSGQGWTYSGVYASASRTWTITGTGTYLGMTRKVVVQVPINVVTSSLIHDDTSVYAYMFADSPSCSSVSLSGNGAVTVPLYSNGCVNLMDHTQFDGNDLEVGGNLNFGPNAGVGQRTQHIGTMNVVGICTGNGISASCGDGNTNPIYANSIGHTLTPPNLHLPAINLQEQNPTCGAGSTNVPAGFFDTDSTLNNPTRAINLFPSGAPYDCKLSDGDEIIWDGVRNFTINGVGPFYFDGSLSMAGTQQVIYRGFATLFFSGTFTMSGQAWLCGYSGVTTTTTGHGNNQSTSYSCNSQWDPAGTRTGVKNELIFVAGCYADSTMSTSHEVTYAGSGRYCVDLTGQNTLQVGSVMNQDYHSGGQATNYGPVVAETLTVAGNPGQLLPLSVLPAGAPTTYTTTLTNNSGGKPYNWNG